MSTNPDHAPEVPAGESETMEPSDSDRWPLGFMLTIVMVSLYVGYRLVQLTVKLFQWLF